MPDEKRELSYRQYLLLFGLAKDAQALKVENGWYGDISQGDSTVEEDQEALSILEGLMEDQREAELSPQERLIERVRKLLLYCQETNESWTDEEIRDVEAFMRRGMGIG